MDGAQFLLNEAYCKVCNNMYLVSLCYLSHIAIQALYNFVWATKFTDEHTASVLTDTVKTYCQLLNL